MASGATASASCCLPMDYETKIFPQIGGYGRYNRVAVVFSWFPTFAVALNLFSDVYFTQIPKLYYCKTDPKQLPSFFSNYSGETYLNLTIPWVDGQGFSHCERYKYPSNITDLSGKVPREKENCSIGWEYPTVVGLQSNILTEWNLVCKDEWKIPRQHVCFMVGWIVGYIFLGSLCDWLGRRRGFLFSITLSSLFGVSGCLSSSALMFLMLRLCQGAMLAGVFVSSYVLRLELSDPPHRLMVTMIGGFFAVSAELLLPGLAILCRNWPVLQAVATLPLILLMSYWCCASVFPESPRWLLATDHIPQAKRSLQEFTKRNGVCLQDEMYPGETLMSEIDSAYGEDHQPKYYSVLELRQTRVIWKNCLILSFTLFIGTGIQYCFTRNLDVYSFYLKYFLRVITGALACVFICLCVNHFGRRGILLLSAIVTGLSSLLLLALTEYLQSGLVLVLSVVGLLFSQALAMLSAFFACEVMPTVVRGGCFGLVMAAGCVGMAASSMMELQDKRGFFLHHVIFASFAILSVLCIMLLPESKRKSLPDSLKEGESQRRPPLFLSQQKKDCLPLLCTRPPVSEYNPDNYSRLVSATRKMLTKDNLPYRITGPSVLPLLSGSNTQKGENGTQEDVAL
ncbi:putative solute carrier family 22 member 31 [Poecilia formosa]|uniref:putative solute carrier family 22 member 31 n=1 Tax=Poecilia formosa TaxID=48698 RepID=UPI0004444B28|nr:PREDICTED: putative solute carrier family 22 member 31 [Poecilia formosa]